MLDGTLSLKISEFPLREGPMTSQIDTRSDLFEDIHSLSAIIPEMRTGQLMAAIGELCADLHGRGLWEATDEEFLEAIWLFRQGVEDNVVAHHDLKSWVVS